MSISVKLSVGSVNTTPYLSISTICHLGPFCIQGWYHCDSLSFTELEPPSREFLAASSDGLYASVKTEKAKKMTAQLLFYQNAAPVSSERHVNTCVKSGTDFGFARKVNSVQLVAPEYADAAAEFPIVFAGEGQNILPTVILGSFGSENLFVGADGQWAGRYIPSFIRGYPFVFSHQVEQGQLVLHVDETFDGVNDNGVADAKISRLRRYSNWSASKIVLAAVIGCRPFCPEPSMQTHT